MRRGLVASRTQAHELIAACRVLVGGALADQPARQVLPGDPIVVTGGRGRFVSRGGEKLDAALERFRIDVRGAQAVDAGASTGGFTDCLLQRGVAHVTAIDVGRGQLHERLAADPRVTNVERTNLRSVTWQDLADAPFDVAVADLSFISLRTVAPPLVSLVSRGGTVVVLVKPQFEVGRRDAARGRGVIRDPNLWAAAAEDAGSALEAAGSTMMGLMVSPLRGADGNVEFLAHLCVVPAPPIPLAARVDIPAVIAEGKG